MPLPVSFDTITITGKYMTLGGDPATGSVTFIPPPAAWLKHIDTDTIIAPTGFVATLNSSGAFSIELPITNDPDVVPTFYYRVTENITGPGAIASRGTYDVALPIDLLPGPIDLSDLVPTGAEVTGSSALSRALADALYVSRTAVEIIDGEKTFVVPPVVPNDSFSVAAIASLEEYIRDVVTQYLVAGTGISLVPNDPSDTLTINNTGGSGGPSSGIFDSEVYGLYDAAVYA